MENIWVFSIQALWETNPHPCLSMDPSHLKTERTSPLAPRLKDTHIPMRIKITHAHIASFTILRICFPTPHAYDEIGSF